MSREAPSPHRVGRPPYCTDQPRHKEPASQCLVRVWCVCGWLLLAMRRARRVTRRVTRAKAGRPASRQAGRREMECGGGSAGSERACAWQ